MENSIELIVRALVIKNRRILVCQTIGKDYFFLPGGHVEFGESVQEAIRRELYEETGAILKVAQFIGAVENIFTQEGKSRHEVSVVFHADIDSDNISSRESHIQFFWFTMEEFLRRKVAPPALKDAIIAWTAEKEPFFIEEKKKV